MNNILYSEKYINQRLLELKSEVEKLNNTDFPPHLEVVLVGENNASLSYIKNKKLMCDKIGAQFTLTKLDENVSKEKFLNAIDAMNTNPKVTGCFVQLPVPKHLADIDITEMINPLKDVDGFHSESILSLYNNKSGFISCTPKGIVQLLKFNNIPIKGSNICVIGRGQIVGKPLSLILQNLDATVTLCHSKTNDIKIHTRNADIIVCAIGKAKFLTKDFLNPKIKQTIIDVGININEDSKLCGDSDFINIKDSVHAITPVPGGVGPMTVISLMENLIYSSELANKTKGQR